MYEVTSSGITLNDKWMIVFEDWYVNQLAPSTYSNSQKRATGNNYARLTIHWKMNKENTSVDSDMSYVSVQVKTMKNQTVVEKDVTFNQLKLNYYFT